MWVPVSSPCQDGEKGPSGVEVNGGGLRVDETTRIVLTKIVRSLCGIVLPEESKADNCS